MTWVTFTPAMVRDTEQQIRDLFEAAYRESVLLGHGFEVSEAARCPACDVRTTAVWFHSRGWVCAWCEGPR
jgi:hypothetical protein